MRLSKRNVLMKYRMIHNKRIKYATMLVILLGCIFCGHNVYAVDDQYFDGIIDNCSNISLGSTQERYEYKYSHPESGACYGVTYKFYAPCTLNISIKNVFDRKSDYGFFYLLDSQGNNIGKVYEEDGTRNAADNTTVCTLKSTITNGYYYIVVNTNYSSSNNSKVISSISASLPQAPSVTSVKKKTKKSVNVKWNRIDGANGYLLYMKKGAGGKYKQVLQTAKTSAAKITIRKKGKYYFKVRAYMRIEEYNCFSSYSGAKKYIKK